MKIAISSAGKDLNSQIDPRFGRCQYFIFIDPETMEFEASENEGLMAWAVQGFRLPSWLPKKVQVPSSRVILDLMQLRHFPLRGLRSIWYLVERSKKLLRAIKREVSARQAEQRFLPTSAWEEAEAWVVAEVNERISRIATNYSNKIFL